MSPYDEILALLKSVHWQDAPNVHRIGPVGHKRLNFFPGQLGFCGERFPFGGIMLIANNFSNLQGWLDYEADLDYCRTSKTWWNLDKYILPKAKIGLSECWFTNYNWGVMAKDTSEYKFEPADQEALGFQGSFEATVRIMQPRAIVVMGEHAADCIGIEFVGQKEHKRQERLYHRRFGESEIPVLSIIHPSARAKTTLFECEGRRIGEALETRTPKQMEGNNE